MPYPWIDWTEILPSIFTNSSRFLNFIVNSGTLLNTAEESSTGDWISNWQENLAHYRKLAKISKVFLNIQRIKNLIHERGELRSKITQLENHREAYLQMSKQELYRSKKQLLETLENKLQSIQDEFEIKKDEYLTYKNQVEQFTQIIEETKGSILILKERQRELYKETNDLTKEMDQYLTQLDNYKEKIMGLDKENKNYEKDYERLTSKQETLMEKIAPLKQKSAEYMAQSKIIKTKLSQMKTIRENERKIAPYRKSFNESSKEYEALKREYDSLNVQIEKTQNEISSMLKEVETNTGIKKGESRSEIDPSRYSSPYIIDENIQTNTARLRSIETKLEELFHTLDDAEITKEIEKRMEDIQSSLEKVKVYKQEIPTYLGERHFLELFITNIKRIERVWNTLLRIMELSVSFDLSFNSDDIGDLRFSLTISRKEKPVSLDEDLKRVEKSYISLAFLCSIYIVNEKGVVPLNTNAFPRELVTKKTFTKSILTLQQEISTLQGVNIPQFVIFLDEAYEGLPHDIQIENP